MNFFKRAKDYFFGQQPGDDDDDAATAGTSYFTASSAARAQQARPVDGVAGDLPKTEPVLCEAGYSGNGGVQGLQWYAGSMTRDQHGDIANEFLHEDQAASAACKAATAQPEAMLAVPTSLTVKKVQQGNVVLSTVE